VPGFFVFGVVCFAGIDVASGRIIPTASECDSPGIPGRVLA
jgi:hypothetical protein